MKVSKILNKLHETQIICKCLIFFWWGVLSFPPNAKFYHLKVWKLKKNIWHFFFFLNKILTQNIESVSIVLIVKTIMPGVRNNKINLIYQLPLLMKNLVWWRLTKSSRMLCLILFLFSYLKLLTALASSSGKDAKIWQLIWSSTKLIYNTNFSGERLKCVDTQGWNCC